MFGPLVSQALIFFSFSTSAIVQDMIVNVLQVHQLGGATDLEI